MADNSNPKRWYALTGCHYVNGAGKSVFAAEFEELKDPKAQDLADLQALGAVIDVDQKTIDAVNVLRKVPVDRLEMLRKVLKI